LQSLQNYYSNLEVVNISAILNGSSNYILSQIKYNHWSYEEALGSAQAKGFAESDPTLDVGGFDARYKLSLINSLLFSQYIPAKRIPIFGIQNISKKSIGTLDELACVIKPLAQTKKLGNGSLLSWVAPAILSEKHLLAQLDNELNGALIDSKYAGEQLLSGKGAGKFPTAAAVFNDLIALVERNYRYQTKENEVENGSSIDENRSIIKVILIDPSDAAAIEPYAEKIEQTDWQGTTYFIIKMAYENLQVFFDLASDKKWNVAMDVDGFFESILEKKQAVKLIDVN
jgi:homoserine dehydrogenase